MSLSNLDLDETSMAYNAYKEPNIVKAKFVLSPSKIYS